MKFFRYGTRRYVGYNHKGVAIIDVDNPNHLRNFSDFAAGRASRPVYWIDWEKRTCQRVWFEHMSDSVKMRSAVITDWEEAI